MSAATDTDDENGGHSVPAQQMGEGWIPAFAGMTVWGAGMDGVGVLRLFSEESPMSAAADTTNHENGHRFLRRQLSYGNVRGWIPAFAGMTVWEYCGLFSYQSFLSAATDAADENGGSPSLRSRWARDGFRPPPE